VCHVFSRLFKVWTHYDQDRSGYIESNELEVLMTNTDKLSAKYIIAPVILVTSGLTTNNAEGSVLFSLCRPVGLVCMLLLLLATNTNDRRLSSTALTAFALISDYFTDS